ncbi:ribose 5-phosphate isomerase [Thermosipho melanesiensis]|uniref:Sugar-phosphate isomerase, RpiB/LacA/LacB family n=2 Tax=Thermosipho melanesiensis TaxID=46541 RepID=A6LM85_THEM4|nr:ribose 5-phosphate isomerase B [Thermosipho melanesiensis]ABR31036.1 sugar-phosphate isomerase, RpiB/LacA/LacB family [Thermosipho melanesiensis BI429]APT74130.1 ribose 5-phosphate isomerase [Thermosipho melanesiensis]OOC36078.1 ribose 5-phosphate isomerase [Thermosipho melanesiensis]OOC36895.1 ribose 5-phosphate isomerase [Thermosipho melanesiensis]OOC37646.1 ribose 5-phosphate isomerase [Thermosipho melanesiensis]
MKIAIGSDHAGFELKEKIKKYLMDKDIDVLDFGTDNKESVDYPDFAEKVGTSVKNKEVEFGILICGTGIGMSIAANKIKGIRAALCTIPEMASLARKHNNANILVLPGRLIGFELATWILDAFLNATFEGGRHERRISKISRLEE